MTFKNKNNDYQVILRSADKYGGNLDDVNLVGSNDNSQITQIENNPEHRLQ